MFFPCARCDDPPCQDAVSGLDYQDVQKQKTLNGVGYEKTL